MTTITGLDAYITCALWSSVDNDGVPMDSNYTAADLAPETLQRFTDDWSLFQVKAGRLLDGLDIDQCGHDFWLTRNHHGAGFWDRGYPGTLGDDLTLIAQSFKECDLYVGDDGKLYVS